MHILVSICTVMPPLAYKLESRNQEAARHSRKSTGLEVKVQHFHLNSATKKLCDLGKVTSHGWTSVSFLVTWEVGTDEL